MKPTTEKFHEMTLEVETDTPGTFAKICGITGRTVNRSLNVQETEVPQDCDDESLPSELQIDPQSLSVTVSGTAVWAAQSHGMMMDWLYLKQRKNIRVGHANASVGDTQYETGYAYLISMNDSAQKTEGAVTREIEIRFDGAPTRTDKAA